MNKNNIEKNILNKISEEHIKPKPKWEFLLKNIYFWVLGTFTVILGALSVSASIFVIKNIKWEFYKATHDNLFTFTIDFLPYLWTVLFIVFLIFTHYLIRKTKHGYRHNLFIIAGITILISIVLGTIFANIGFGQLVDGGFGNKILLHRGIEMRNNLLWNNPDDGFLMGEITSVEDVYSLESLDGKTFNLTTEHLNEENLNILNSKDTVRIIGFKKEGSFYICLVLPNMREKMDGNGPKQLFERKEFIERNKECEGIQPYQRLLNN